MNERHCCFFGRSTNIVVDRSFQVCWISCVRHPWLVGLALVLCSGCIPYALGLFKQAFLDIDILLASAQA